MGFTLMLCRDGEEEEEEDFIIIAMELNSWL
jgi:hypothetical protein